MMNSFNLIYRQLKQNLQLLILAGLLAVYGTSNAQKLPNFVDIVRSEKGKVVHISTTTKIKRGVPDSWHEIFPNFPPNFSPNTPNQDSKALGTGFFYSADGYIVTNNHVIQGADKIEVLLDNNDVYPAKVIGHDERTDLALLKIEAKQKFKPMRWGDSSKVEIGQWVIAIGNPLGLDQTVTAGIISAKNRDILGGTAYGSFLQTDAAINVGNSGGPLLNTKGEVIGINTAIAGGQGLGFAIPSNLARSIIKQLLTKGKVTRGWLGVSIQEVDSELIKSLELKAKQTGVLILQVIPNSPADKGGLQDQDIIVAVNNRKIVRVTELQQIIAETAPGSTVRIKVLRNKKVQTKIIKIVEFKEEHVENLTQPSPGTLGLKLVAVNSKIKSQYNLHVDKGLLITEILTDSPLKNKLSAGDVILKINNDNVTNISKFREKIGSIKANTPFVLLINRFGSQLVISGKK